MSTLPEETVQNMSLASMSFKEFQELLLKPKVLDTLQQYPQAFEYTQKLINKRGQGQLSLMDARSLGKAQKVFKENLHDILKDQCTFVPQGYTVVCPNNQAKGFMGTSGLATCVLCVIRSSSKTAVGHCDGAEKETDLKEIKEKNYTEAMIKEMGEDAKITLLFEDSTGKELAEKLAAGFQNKDAIEFRAGKTDGGFIVLQSGDIISLYDAAKLIFPLNKERINGALKLSDNSTLYHVTNKGLLHVQDKQEPYELYT